MIISNDAKSTQRPADSDPSGVDVSRPNQSTEAKGIESHHVVEPPQGLDHKHVVIGGTKKNANHSTEGAKQDQLNISVSEEHLDIEDVIESALKLNASDITSLLGQKSVFVSMVIFA